MSSPSHKPVEDICCESRSKVLEKGGCALGRDDLIHVVHDESHSELLQSINSIQLCQFQYADGVSDGQGEREVLPANLLEATQLILLRHCEEEVCVLVQSNLVDFIIVYVSVTWRQQAEQLKVGVNWCSLTSSVTHLITSLMT